MGLILNSLMPLSFVIFLGWLAGIRNIVNAKHGSLLATYVMSFSFPCLLLAKTASTTISDLINIKFIFGFTCGIMGMYLFAFIMNKLLYKRSLAESCQAAFVSSFPDMAFMGIPIFSVLFGSQALLSIVIGNIITSLMMIPLTVSILDFSQKKTTNSSILKLLLSVFKKPLVISPVIGIILSYCGYKLPHLFSDSLMLIGGTTSGVSLFALGLIMSADRVVFNKFVVLNIIKKLILHPLLMWLIVITLDIKSEWAQQAVLLCAMPSAIMTTMFAVKYDVIPQESSSSTILGTLVALFSMAICMYLLGIGQ